MKKILPSTLLALFIFIGAPDAKADEFDDSRPLGDTQIPVSKKHPKWGVDLGAGFITKPEFEGSDKQEYKIFPFAQAYYKFTKHQKIYWRGISGGYQYTLNKNLKFGLVLTTRRSRDADDDSRLLGMPDIDTAYEIGPWVQYNVNKWKARAALRADISGEYDGFGIDLRLSRKIKTHPNIRANVYAEAKWGDKNLMDHYFSVSAAQATANRAQFNANSSIYKTSLGVNSSCNIHKHIFLLATAKVNFLVGDAADSSVVFRDTSITGILGLGYKF